MYFLAINVGKQQRPLVIKKNMTNQVFPLYKSYETDNGRELVTDKRQNALSKSSIKYIAFIALIVFGFSFYKLFTFF